MSTHWTVVLLSPDLRCFNFKRHACTAAMRISARFCPVEVSSPIGVVDLSPFRIMPDAPFIFAMHFANRRPLPVLVCCSLATRSYASDRPTRKQARRARRTQTRTKRTQGGLLPRAIRYIARTPRGPSNAIKDDGSSARASSLTTLGVPTSSSTSRSPCRDRSAGDALASGKSGRESQDGGRVRGKRGEEARSRGDSIDRVEVRGEKRRRGKGVRSR